MVRMSKSNSINHSTKYEMAQSCMSRLKFVCVDDII